MGFVGYQSVWGLGHCKVSYSILGILSDSAASLPEPHDTILPLHAHLCLPLLSNFVSYLSPTLIVTQLTLSFFQSDFCAPHTPIPTAEDSRIAHYIG